ncbi:MAG: hypothetical protein ACR2QH_06150 [Geminicoccaceae bacterium]
MTTPAAEASPAMASVLRRALMRANPAYFHWPVERQERYRLTMPDDHAFSIERQLFKELFDIEIQSEKDAEEAFDEFGPEDCRRYNTALLPIKGIGEDCFFLNEHLGEKTLLDFETLYDYDLDDHNFQEEARQQEWSDYVKKPYRGALYLVWARLFVDQQFTYATLSCAAGYVFSQTDSYGHDVIDELVPHRYVEGDHHGKREGAGYLFDMRVDADGKEEQLDELQARFVRYQIDHYEEQRDLWDREALGVAYIIPGDHDDDPNLAFVFTDKTAMQQIRFRHFLRDSRAIECDPALLHERVAAEKKRLRQFLETQRQDIEANDDPKIRRFRKKRKIIVHPDAAKDLL